MDGADVYKRQVYKGRDFQATLVGLDASAMTARALLERFTSDHAKNFVNYNNPCLLYTSRCV